MALDWWTLGIQAINVLILVWLLRRFFWEPVAAIIAKRRVESQKMLDQAAEKQNEVDEAQAAIEETRRGFETEREAILKAAQTDASNIRASARAKAEAEADALRQNAESELARVTRESKKAQSDQACALAVEIAAKLAARLDGAAVRAAFLDWLIAEIDAMSEPERLSDAMKDAPLEVVSATPLSAAEQARIARKIAASFGVKPKFTFKTDETLIAGFELRNPHFILRNSWKADLDRIRAGLVHD